MNGRERPTRSTAVAHGAADELLKPRSKSDPRNRDVGHERQLDPRLVSLVRPASFEADQYRTLRHAVELASGTSACRILAITSPVSGDGKTLTAINLAGVLARASDARVLLVDADLRRPAVAEYLGQAVPERPGLAEAILNREQALDETVWRLDSFNLSLVTARRTDMDPSELLGSARFGELIEDARRSYDYVLLDAAPLNPVPDGWVLDQWVDKFLMVVAEGRTPRKLLEEAVLRLGPTRILGFVFNADRHARSRYGKYYDGYYSRK